MGMMLGDGGDIMKMWNPTPWSPRTRSRKGAGKGEVECLPYPHTRVGWRNRFQTSSSWIISYGGAILNLLP